MWVFSYFGVKIKISQILFQSTTYSRPIRQQEEDYYYYYFSECFCRRRFSDSQCWYLFYHNQKCSSYEKRKKKNWKMCTSRYDQSLTLAITTLKQSKNRAKVFGLHFLSRKSNKVLSSSLTNEHCVIARIEAIDYYTYSVTSSL